MVIWWLSHPYPPYDSELGTQGAVSSWLQPCSLGRCLIQTGGCWWKFKTGYPHICMYIYIYRLVLFDFWLCYLKPGMRYPSTPQTPKTWFFVSRQICKVAARTAPMTGALKLLPQQSLNKLGLSIVNPNLIWSSLARPCKAQKSEAVSTQPRNMYLPLGTMQGDSPSRNAKRSLAYILTTTPMSSLVPISF